LAQARACPPLQTHAAAHFLFSDLSSTHEKASVRLLGACRCSFSQSGENREKNDRELLGEGNTRYMRDTPLLE